MSEPGSFQRLIEDIYYERDSARGVQGTLLWFVEEVGELLDAELGGPSAEVECLGAAESERTDSSDYLLVESF